MCSNSPNSPADNTSGLGLVLFPVFTTWWQQNTSFQEPRPLLVTLWPRKRPCLPLAHTPWLPQPLQSLLWSPPQEFVCYPGPRDLLLLHLLQGEGQHRYVALGRCWRSPRSGPVEGGGEGDFRCGSTGLWEVPALYLSLVLGCSGQFCSPRGTTHCLFYN